MRNHLNFLGPKPRNSIQNDKNDRKVPEKRYACESIEDQSQNGNPGIWLGDIGNQISEESAFGSNILKEKKLDFTLE